MNKKEVKNLLKRRNVLVKLHADMNKDATDIINSDSTKIIYKNGRNNIGDILFDIDKDLLGYVKTSPVGEWLLKIKGITPDLAAGLLAYFNIKNKTCAAQFIKYSGTDNCNNPHNNNVSEIIDRVKDNFKSDPESLYGRLCEDKFIELLNDEEDIPIDIARLKSERYMKKIFISHLFEEMYREEHDGQLSDRYNVSDCIIIEPEVVYTR